VTIDVAVEARRKLFAEIEGIGDMIVPRTLAATDVALRLLDSNLISGMVDGQGWAE
jgi:hypothetical protein